MDTTNKYKKVEAIVNIIPPKNMKQLWEFIGIINYYRDMWARQSHLLHPLTALMLPKVDFKWTDVEQKVFDEIKCTVARKTLRAYPYFNKRFDIHTDVSNHQLGSVIIQEGKTIAFYSGKLTETQKGYTLTDKEFLSIVKTLKGFRTILLGRKLKLYTAIKSKM